MANAHAMRKYHFLLAFLVVLVDQGAKWLVARHVGLHDSLVVIPGLLRITHVQNRGAAFGLFSDSPSEWKIGVLIELSSEKGDDERVSALARQLAMHVAAASPKYLNRAEVPAEVVEKEKEIMRVKAKESGKPDNIIEKILDGQINKFYGEVCLLEQAYVIDPDQKVNKVVEALGKEIGAPVKLSRFVRFQLGEGLEKRADDFAAEVAALNK